MRHQIHRLPDGRLILATRARKAGLFLSRDVREDSGLPPGWLATSPTIDGLREMGIRTYPGRRPAMEAMMKLEAK